GGRNAGKGCCDPDAGSHEDGADPARALCGRVEEDQVQGRRYRRRRRRTRRTRAGGLMSDRVHIVEVGPRDGLQNEKTPISVADRITFIEALIAAGLHTVEVGAFVSPKAIPQMVGSDQVLRGVSQIAGAEFHVLVPNEKGYEASQAAGAKVIAVFASASEGFSRAN